MSSHVKPGGPPSNIPKTLLYLSGTLALILCVSLCMVKGIALYTTVQSIKTYEDSMRNTHFISQSAIDALEDQWLQLRESTRDSEPLMDSEFPADSEPPGLDGTAPHVIDTITKVRALLTRASIQPERFRITGNDPDSTVECILHCAPESFFSFLEELSEVDHIAVTYLNLKPGSGSDPVHITMRIKHAL
jgi:hypothetical protein